MEQTVKLDTAQEVSFPALQPPFFLSLVDKTESGVRMESAPLLAINMNTNTRTLLFLVSNAILL